ncbi:MAG TPA: LysR family transcriptional regulator, partial [Saprospiraceae bacterium]|nr:LysR family transcriptional regulator [Saprospiraceae bacterium]
MELRQLKYFVTVYEEGQFVKAAEKLHITQSALSQQIQVLEQELGAPLFDKHKRKVQRIVSSTPVGKEFYKDAKKIIELSDRLVNKVKDLVSKDLVIRFGTYQLLNKKQIINTIEKIRSRYPLALFKISEFSTPSDVQMALKDDLIDCGVTILPIAH